MTAYTGRLRLAELREQKGVSQRAAAKAVGISQSMICFYERGDVYPKVGVLFRLAEYYGVYIEGLFEKKEVS